MAQSDLYLGRGIVTIGGADIGLVSALQVLHEIEQAPRRVFDGTADGGIESVARRVVGVRLEMQVHEYQAGPFQDWLQASAGGEFWAGTQAAQTFLFDGVNAHEGACTAVDFSAPLFLPDPPDFPLLSAGLASFPLTGQLLRNVGGTPEWYTWSIS